LRFADDLYVVDAIYQSYLRDYWNNNEHGSIHFNHASITAPLPFVHKSAQEICNENLNPDSAKRLRIIEETRRKTGCLLNMEDHCVAFANNTTDAASLVFWLSGLRKGDSVITTDAENESIPRIFKYFMDHANPGDGWVSWQNFAQYSNSEKGLIKKRPTGVNAKTVRSYGVDDDSFLSNLINRIDRRTKLIVFCHVLRENGRIIPVKTICRAIRETNPDVAILVDGAQCLGTLPKIDFKELGCDFYLATPHKTLCSETVGVLFMDPRYIDTCRKLNHVPRDKQIIKKDQFSQSLMIRPNNKYAVSLPEIHALNLVIDYYQKEGWVKNNDFSAVDRHLKTLKRDFIGKLAHFDVEILSPMNPSFTNFICSCRFRSLDNRKIAMKCWNKMIFLSYIYRSNVIRASFSITNTLQEIEKFERETRQIIAERRDSF